jgi:hypothetical protein
MLAPLRQKPVGSDFLVKQRWVTAISRDRTVKLTSDRQFQGEITLSSVPSGAGNPLPFEKRSGTKLTIVSRTDYMAVRPD